MKTIIFLHIPKTGGLTFKQVLLDCFPNSKVFPKHIANNASDYIFKTFNFLSDYKIITGHWDWGIIDELDIKNLEIIVFLRDPISRYISQYNYLKKHKDKYTQPWYEIINSNSLSCEEFYNVPSVKNSLSNLQVKQLAGYLWSKKQVLDEMELLDYAINNLKKIHFIGLFETLQNSIHIYLQAKSLCFNYTIPHINKSNYKKQSYCFPNDLYLLDQQLYNEALKIANRFNNWSNS